MTSKFLLVILGFVLVKRTETLKCDIGFDVNSNVLTKNRWEQVDCASDDNVCQKFQGEIVIYNKYRSKLLYVTCYITS